MTIKELATFTGKNKSTISRWIAKCNSNVFNDRLQNATNISPVDFDIDEIEEILTTGSMSKDAVSILMNNARNKEVIIEPQNALLVMMKSQQDFMIAVLDKLDKIGLEQPLQLTAPKEDYFSLVGYTSLNGIKTNRSGLALHGRTLKKMAVEKSLILKSIPDERWGKVNSYPVELLDEYFSA